MPQEQTQKHSRKREDMVHAAEELFLKKGIRAVTVEEIVSHSQVSKRTFYKYFADKKDILEPVLLRLVEVESGNLAKLVEQGKQSRMTQQAFLQIFDVNVYDRFFQSEFTRELLQDYPDLVQKLTDNWLSKVLPIFRELVRMAKIDGIVRMDIDTEVLFIFIQMIRRGFSQNPHTPEHMSMREFTGKVFEIFLYGVVERGAGAPETPPSIRSDINRL